MMRFFHIHWHRETGMCSMSVPGDVGWSTIWRCRCGHKKLKKM